MRNSLLIQYGVILTSVLVTGCFPKLASEDIRSKSSLESLQNTLFLKGLPSTITINKGTPSYEVEFLIEATGAGQSNLKYEVKDSPVLKPKGVAVAGNDSARKLKLTPEADAYGSADIHFSLETDLSQYEQKLRLIVNAPPAFEEIADQSSIAGQAAPSVLVKVSDPDSLDFTLTAISSNQTLIPNNQITLAPTTQGYLLSLTPKGTATGSAIITLTADDGFAKTQISYLHTVSAGLTIGALPNLQINQNSQLAPVSFTISDSGATLTATSSNTSLIPNANITISGTGSSRSISAIPASGQHGSATITLNATSGTHTANSTFTLQVNALPTIAAVSNQATLGTTPISNLAITLNDPDTASLTFSATSSNTTLLPNENIVLGGSGNNRTLSLTAANNQYGNSLVTLSASDGFATVERTFLFTVNGGPTIGTISNQTIAQNASSSSLAFSVSDPVLNANNLYISATSNNTTLLPSNSYSFGGSGTNRTLTVTPASGQYGSATITLTISNGSQTATTTFNLQVAGVPTLSQISNQSSAGGAVSGINFTVSDPDTDLNTLTVSASSSNTAVLANSDIVIGGSGGNRTLSLTPIAGSSGTSTITLSATDGVGTATTTFTLSVSGPPSIASINNQTWNQDQNSSNISVTLSDPSGNVNNLTLTGSSSNTALIPNSGLTFSGSGANRTLVISPTSGQYGNATITLTVNNGSSSSTRTFTATVNAKPTVEQIANQSSIGTTLVGPLSFSVSDPDGAAGNLTVTATSNNQTLIPDANIILGGSNGSRTIELSAESNQFGSATITVYANDGSLNGFSTFNVTVYRPATQLHFAGSGYGFPGTCSPLRIQALNAISTESIVSSPVQVNLSQDGNLVFYSNSNCTTTITSTTIAAQTSSKLIYFKNSSIESITLTATDNAGVLTAANYALTIQQSLPNNLVAYYRFNEASWSNNVTADVQDSSGNNYHALAIGNSMTAAGAGIDGSGAAFFNGTNYIQTDTTAFPITGTSARTVAFWGKVSAAQTGDIGMFRMGSWTASPNYQAFGFNYNRNNHTTYVGSYTNWSQMNVPNHSITDSWVHFTVVYHGSANAATTGTVVVYMNGALMSIGWLNVDSASNRLLIGYGTHTYRFRGWMDEFMVYNRALGHDEIQQLQSLAPPAKLAFLRTPPYIHAGTCDPITIANVNENNQNSAAFANRTITLSGLSNAVVYSDAGCQTPIANSQVTIPAGESSTKFYLKNSTPETISMSATDNSAKTQSTSVSIEFKAPLPSGLLAYYRFEEPLTSARLGHDSSGNATTYPLIFHESARMTTSQSMDSSQSVYFYDSYARTTSEFPITGTSAYTVSFWAKTNANGDPVGLYGFGSSCTNVTGCRSALYFHPDNRLLYLYNYTSQLAYSLNETAEWQHYTVVKQPNSTRFTFYINGELLGYSNITTNITSAFLHIGYAHASNIDMRGWMDEFMVYNRALNPSEVKSLYKKASPVKLAWVNPQAYSHANTCEKFTLVSQTSDNKHSALNSNITVNLGGVSNGFFYSTPNCSDAGKITSHSITMNTGESEKFLYYKNSTVETLTLTATESTNTLTQASVNHKTILPLPSNLMAYYRFNEIHPNGTIGEIHDYSANATIYPLNVSTSVSFTTTSDSPDSTPNVYFYDSYAASVDSFPLTGSTPYSVSFWAKLIPSDNSGLFSFGTNCTNATGCRSAFYYHSTNDLYYLYNYTTPITFSASNVNQWLHYTLVKQPDTHRVALYINGEFRGYSNLTANLTANPLHIGYAFADAMDMRGWMDEFMVFNRALTPSEAKALYKKAVPTQLAWTNFQDKSYSGTCEKVELHSQTSDGKLAAVHFDKTITFSGMSQGFFYTNSNCSDASKITNHTVTLERGQSRIILYYKNNTVENVSIAASDTSTSMSTATKAHQSILPLPTGLVAYYRFNEAHPTGETGQVHDAAPVASPNPLTLSTGVSFAANTSGADSSSSIYFYDSYANTVNNAPISGSGAYSVSFWSKIIPTDTIGFFGFGSNCTINTGCRSAFYYHSTNRHFYHYNYTTPISFSNPSNSQVTDWQHYSIVKQPDSNKLAYYINGEFAAYSDLSFNIHSTALHIGYAHADAMDMRGWMDEFMIYNRALTPSEAKALYKREQPTQLAWANVSSTHNADTCERIAIQTRAADGKLAAVATNTVITLSGKANGFFYTEPTCTQAGQQLSVSGSDQTFTLNAGQSEQILYYRNNQPQEIMTWTASASGLTSATQSVTTLASLPSGLISYLRLNEGEFTAVSGEFHDSSGSSTYLPFSGTTGLSKLKASEDPAGNDPRYTQKDINGNASPLYFYGYNAPYIYSESTTFPTTGTSARTFAFWVKQIDGNNSNNYGYFRVGSGATTTGAYTSFYYAYGNDTLYLMDHAGSTATYSSVIPFNAWKHVVLTKPAASNVYSLYIDGAYQGTMTSATNTGAAGRMYWGYGNGFTVRGWMDELMVFDRNIDSTEVNQIYQRWPHPQ